MHFLIQIPEDILLTKLKPGLEYQSSESLENSHCKAGMADD